MVEVKPKLNKGQSSGMFDPMSYDGITLRCCCGYELIKQDADTYRCTGGSHVYRISQGDVELDKFGNVILKIPDDQAKIQGGKGL